MTIWKRFVINMEIEVDDNIGAVHNDTLIGDDKKNI